MTSVYLVRHAETQFNVEGRLQGHSDSPLTELGRRQAEQLRQRLHDVPFTVCFTSTSPRARTTAGLLLGTRAIAIREDARLIEMGMGEWEGVAFKDLEERFPGELARFRGQDHHFRAPGGGESPLEVRRRMVAAFEALTRAHPEGPILVVSHGAAVRSVLAHCLGTSVAYVDIPRSRNCALSIIEWSDGAGRLELAACDRHLDPLVTG